MTKLLVIAGLVALTAAAWFVWPAQRLSPDDLRARYTQPVSAPDHALRNFDVFDVALNKVVQN